MCINVKRITNKYTGKELYVPCGHCIECQQRKASRHMTRIYNHEYERQFFSIFLTLDYSNQCLPYVDFSSPENNHNTFCVYRDCQVRWRGRRGKSSKREVKVGRFKIGEFVASPSDCRYHYNDNYDGLNVPIKFIHKRAVSVLWSKDFKSFIDRFRKNLFRHYGLKCTNENFSYYKVGEYGPTTHRAHFHAKLYFPKSWAQFFPQIKRAIVSAWPFCCRRQADKGVEIAKAGQRYLSQYCVRPTEYPDFLKIRKISQKPSFSIGFGFNQNLFSPYQIQEQVSRRDFRFPYSYIDASGHSITALVPTPKYVMYRYFPNFKGMHLLTSEQVLSVLQHPALLYQLGYPLGYESTVEVRSAVRRLTRASSLLHMSQFDYGFYYQHVKTLHSSTNLMRNLLDCDDFSEYYDNPAFIVYCQNFHHLPSVLNNFDTSFVPSAMSCNEYLSRINDNNKAVADYYDFLKLPKVNDYAKSLNIEFITYELKPKSYGKHFKDAQVSCQAT